MRVAEFALIVALVALSACDRGASIEHTNATTTAALNTISASTPDENVGAPTPSGSAPTPLDPQSAGRPVSGPRIVPAGRPTPPG